MTQTQLIPLFAIVGMAVASCAAPPIAPPKDYMLSCLHETRAKGSYVRSFEKIRPNGLPKVVPADGGNIRGAVLIEACIDSHHKRAGTLPEDGQTEPVMLANGKLSVPQGYNLSTHDRALWPSLTLQQQKRALAFLKEGSTIQSSLLED